MTNGLARLAAILLAVILASLCTLPASAETIPAQAEIRPLRIAVSSDLHMDPDNSDRTRGTQVVYNQELVDALLRDAKEQGAAFILITGDLVSSGRRYRHEALTEKLRRAEAEGLDVYVLPGNHDLGPVSQAEFLTFYEDFGYGEAFSRDESSLSYCVIRDGLMLLMMDTAGYRAEAFDLPGAPKPASDSTFFTKKTLAWAETCLARAREDGLKVLAAGHYNLLPEISRRVKRDYSLENGERFADLLHDYGVPLYLSGHMHFRDACQEDGLTELLTGYLLGYPTGYSLLDIDGDGIRYTPRRIDVEAWAAEVGEEDPVLLNYAEWQQDGLFRSSVINVQYMAERNPISREEQTQAAGFLYTVMNSFWDGSLSEKRPALEALPGCEPYFRCAAGFDYGWWVESLIENATPLLQGFEISW